MGRRHESRQPADARPILAYLADYYPFGWLMPDRKVLEYRYGYQGNEADPETGWTAFQLRMYDGRVGRWMSFDPAKQYASPYLAMGNAPIKSIDPDGGRSKPDDWYRNNSTGEIQWFNGSEAKQGFTHLGEDLTFYMNSFINGAIFDGPGGRLAGGNKLMSTVNVDASQDENGNLLKVDITSKVEIGRTFGLFQGVPRYPGLSNSSNMIINSRTDNGNIIAAYIFEQHARVPWHEQAVMNLTGYDIVNVAQKLKIEVHET